MVKNLRQLNLNSMKFGIEQVTRIVRFISVIVAKLVKISFDLYLTATVQLLRYVYSKKKAMLLFGRKQNTFVLFFKFERH